MSRLKSKETQHNVRVMVRFRPERDIEFNAKTNKTFIVYYGEDEQSVQLEQRDQTKGTALQRSYMFDRVFGPNATQDYVFEHLAKATVDDVVKGFNGTIFAYGQTGSGKTFSMFGPENKPINGPHRGIIPRAAEYLFEQLQSADDVRQVTIKLSFLEIYKEQVRDLLNESMQPLKLRETPSGSVRVLGVEEQYVSTPEDVLKLILAGNSIRATSRTDMNDVSSRSHTVLTLTVTEKLQDASIRVGKLHLADLAGSERADKSGLVGATLQEAKKINQSLAALGNCINALTDSKRSHVPFRDSRLTYILKDSLGGNTKTTLLVTCSPHAANSDETLSSLKFAQRAQHVKNSVRINRQLSVQELQNLVDKLRKQLSQSRSKIKQMQKSAKRGGKHGGMGYDYDDNYGSNYEMDQAMRSRTLPSNPTEAAALYAALGQAGIGQAAGDYAAQVGSVAMLKKGQTLPTKGPFGGGLTSGNGSAAMNYNAAYAQAYQYGRDDTGVGMVSADVTTSAAAQERMMMKQRLYNGLRKLESGSAQSGVATLNGPLTAVEDNALTGVIPSDQQTGSVLQRAKAAIRRSLASRSSLDPLDKNGDAGSGDDSDSSSSSDDNDDEERKLAKKQLQEELRAAKKRREDILSAQRRRADQWAADKLDTLGATGGSDKRSNKKAWEDARTEERLLKEELRLAKMEASRAAAAKEEMEREAERMRVRKLREQEVEEAKRRSRERRKKKKERVKKLVATPASTEPRMVGKRTSKMGVVPHGDLQDPGTPDAWSPVTSPIPPPPSYPYPIAATNMSPPVSPGLPPPPPGQHPKLAVAARSANGSVDDSAVDLSINDDDDEPSVLLETKEEDDKKNGTLTKKKKKKKGPRRERKRNKRTGMIEFRIDLVPDPDSDNTEVQHLGFVERADADIKLIDFRAVILEELDDVPPSFIFTRKGVPIGLRQERKRTVNYIANYRDNAIGIRIDNSRSGD